MELDPLDKLANAAFESCVVRKDLVRDFKAKNYPVPTYVIEFLLGRYCATCDEEEIREGLALVEKQLEQRAIRTGEEELFKSRAREQGSIKLIDIVNARLDTKSDEYLAELPSLKLRDVRIGADLVTDNERLLTGGFYAEVTLTYDASIAQEKNGRPFGIEQLRPIQLSSRDVLGRLEEGRAQFSDAEWKNFLLRSIGLEAIGMEERAKDILLLRMLPFVENNYNMVEIGPRGTGKSHLFQQVSPYAHLVSGGKASVAKMFVNNANGQRGLVCQYDVVCFDEVSGVSFDQKDGVNIMKGYMESGEFSRGKESIRANGSMVLVGNFDVDVQHQQRVSHLFGPLPPEMRNDTAFMDRIHCYLPGWDIPKMNRSLFTSHFGLVSDFLAECFSQMRTQSRASSFQGRLRLGNALSGRDTRAVEKTVSGLLKLMHPGKTSAVSDEQLDWAVRLALEVRRRVKEQQKRIGATEFRNTHFSYTIGEDGVEKFVCTPELSSDNSINSDPLEAGQIWAISCGSLDENPGLYRVEVNVGQGSGVKILNHPVPQAFKECVRIAEQNLYSRASQLLGDRDPRAHEFSVQLRAFDGVNSGSGTGMPVFIALAGALLHKSVKGGLVVVGSINLGGSIDQVHNAIALVEIAVDKGASTILMPVSCRRQLNELPDELWTKIDIQFYGDARDALMKALVE